MELVAFNQQTHETIQDLNTRLRSVEIADAFGLAQEQHGEMPVDPLLQLTYGHRGAGDARSRSPSQERQDYRQREMPGNFRNGSFRKGNGRSRTHLQISIPGKLYAPPSVGLPTPKTSSAVSSAPSPSRGKLFGLSRRRVYQKHTELQLTSSCRLRRLRRRRRHH
jgi:hypothetical protein